MGDIIVTATGQAEAYTPRPVEDALRDRAERFEAANGELISEVSRLRERVRELTTALGDQREARALAESERDSWRDRYTNQVLGC